MGDALGAPVEFMRRAEIVRQFGTGGVRDYLPAYSRVGAITDDTQMTLFTAEGILRGHVASGPSGQFGPAFVATIANAYLRWLSTQGRTGWAMVRERAPGWLVGHPELFSRRAPGNTCLSALESMRSLTDRTTNNSKGCGGVMRVAPVGMYAAHVDLKIFETAIRLSHSTRVINIKSSA